MHHPNFTSCAQKYLATPSYIQQYGWKGPVFGVPKNNSTQISVHGCEELCGTGTQLYQWPQIANTITTWVLPAIGVIVQAPFESNKNWTTLRCLARWIGSPISSMTYVLWNINVTGRCAMLVDMATPYGNKKALDDADFLDIRDSFYLLSAMNQFVMDQELHHADGQKWTDGLLRVVLFSRDLRLTKYPDSTRERKLQDLRKQTAYYLRTHRKRGVVPVIISIFWFIVAMAISIQSAFGEFGQNAAAHDLAIGLLLAWLPLLMLATIVDRNFISSNTVRSHLNELIYETAVALARCRLESDTGADADHVPVSDYLKSLRDEMKDVQDRDVDISILTSWHGRMDDLVRSCRSYVQPQEDGSQKTPEFFREFSGQARIRRHHGVANTILVSIEQQYVLQKGRNWLLSDEPLARLNLVLGRSLHGLLWYDKRELIQLSGATFIVATAVIGAFVLSFCVPTVGLGCRSGSYMIFLIIAFFLQIVELGTWGLVVLWRTSKSSKHQLHEYGGLARFALGMMKTIRYLFVTEGTHAIALKWLDDWFFGIFETFNMLALCCIVLLQTIGGFETCRCQASTWSYLGGYIDFTEYNVADVPITHFGWVVGTTVSCAILGLTMIWIVIQWVIQSHISTEDLQDAKDGLMTTRRFTRLVYVYIWPFVRFWPLIGIAWHRKDGTGRLRPESRAPVPTTSPEIKLNEEFRSSGVLALSTRNNHAKNNDPSRTIVRKPVPGHRASASDQIGLLVPDDGILSRSHRRRSSDYSRRTGSSDQESYNLPELNFSARNLSPFPSSDEESHEEEETHHSPLRTHNDP